MEQPLGLPLYKEKNYDLELKLYKTGTDEIYQNRKATPVSVALYLAVDPPRKLEYNM